MHAILKVISILGIAAFLPACNQDSVDSASNEAAPANAPAAAIAVNNILHYPIHQHRLANGLNVVTVTFDSPGTAAFFTVFRVGSRDEVEKGVTGFAHFFEHMMFRGTDKYPSALYESVLKSIGASANANTSNDRTIYHMTGNKDKLELMFEIEADRFMNLNYSEHDFKTEAGAVKGEYTKNFASPYAQIDELTQETAFTTHTYSHTTMGYFADIVDMPNQFAYSKTFFERFYRPEYATIIVVGDVSPDTVDGLAEKYFAGWQHGSYVSQVTAESPQTETRAVHLQDASIPAFFSLNYKGPAFNDSARDMATLDILAQLLFTPTAPLYKKLVIDELKVRNLSGGASDSRDPGLFTIQVSLVDKADMQYVKDAIVAALEAIKMEGVSAQRLADTQSNLKYRFALGIDNPDAIANSLAHYTALTGDPESINRLYAQYDKVTVADVQAIASQYFVDNALTIATISEDAAGDLR